MAEELPASQPTVHEGTPIQPLEPPHTSWGCMLVALLVLSAAVLIGLLMANQIARPIGRLIHAFIDR